LFYSLRTNIPGLEAIEVVEQGVSRARALTRLLTRSRSATKRSIAFVGLGLFVVIAALMAYTPSAQGLSVSNTDQILTTTGGGGLIGPVTCNAGEVIYGIGAGGNSGLTSITEPLAWCATLSANGTTRPTWTRNLGGTGWGGTSNYSLTGQWCGDTQALVGLVAHKQSNGYVSGWQLICGTLPGGTSRTTSSTIFGWSNAGTSSPSQRETIQCPTGMVAMGMLAYVGSIMDKIGFRCGTISGATQDALSITSTSGTYGSNISLTTSGGLGSGSVSYAVTSAGTAGCSVSGSTLSATAAGTCTVTATKAGDTNYSSISSSATTVTFSKLNQTITFTNPGTKEFSSTPFSVAPTASSGLTVSISSSTTSVCTTSGFNITMVTTGTCTIVASQSGNGNYNAATDVSNSFTIQDTTAPTVSSTSISSSAGADNTYIAGDSIQVTVNFSEAVTVTGTPTITMVVGSTSRSASYLSGSGTTALVFGYTVVAGETDSNGVVVTSNTLSANGGTIRDASSNNATLTNTAISASLSHLVDTTAPTVTLSRSGSGTILSGQTVTITFTFSESVTGFDSSDIQRCPSSASNGSFGAVSGSGSTYTAVFTPTADTASGNANLCLGPGAVSDAGGNAMTAWSSILNMTVDTRLPTVTAFTSSTTNGTYAAGSSIAISATTSEAVQSGNTITVTLDTGATVTLTAASAGTTLSGTYTVAVGNSSSDLTVSSFTIGTVLDTAGNAMTSTTVPSGASNIAGSKAIVIEAIAPTVTAFSSSTADGTYAIGATVSISATTSEAIQSGNTITVTLETGATDRTVTLTAASAGTSLTGTYTVQSGDTTSDLTVSSFTIGTVLDTAGNAMTSTSVPSGASNIAGAKAIVVDGVVPTMTVSASPTSVSSGGTSTITFTASEATSTFALADASTTLGSLSNFQSVSSTSYTATFTAAQSVGGTAVVTVASGSFSDSAGNASTAAFTGNITVNNTTTSSGGRVAALSGNTNYIVERFTTAGASTWVAPRGVTRIDLLVVGGGGGGGSRGAGGGGAGGLAETTNYTVTPGTSYSVAVGAGGSGGPSNAMVSGSAGSASSFLLSGTGLTANGGGAGNAHGVSSASGGASGTATGTGAVASNAGGTGKESGLCGSGDWCGGGGGGTGAAGTAAVSTGGNGGAGRASSITGTSVTYGGGGGGGGGDSSSPSSSPTAGGTGGSGGGGDGGTTTWNASTSVCTPSRGGNGTANTGSGGGGGGYCNYNYSGDPQGGGGNGGTGIVVVRYALPDVSTPDLDTADDSGTSSTDNITSATTLTFTGSAPVGSTVQLYVDGVASGSTCATNASTGLWSCDTDVLTAGDKVITAVSTTVLTDSTVTSTSATGLTVTIDTTAPTVSSISASSSTLKSGETSTLTITLSESSTTFAVGDITVSGGTLSSFAGSGSSYTVVFTPTANTQTGTGSVSVALGTFTDTAGTNNTASSTTTITYDTQVATVSSLSVTSSAGADNFYVASDSIRVTVNFSEAVTVTGTPTISLLVGAITRSASYISGSGTSALVFGYTAVAGDNDTDGVSVTANTLSAAGGTINDAVGNVSTLTHSAVAASTSHKVDTTAPTVSSISASSSTLKSGQTSTLTFTLSEAASDFVVGDITVSGGTLSSFTGVSSTSYTVVFTPTANTQSGTGSISVASGAFSDAAGNSNTASSTTSITYDTQAPSVSSISASSSTLKSGQTSTLTITLSESSTTFVIGDITVSGGTLSSFTGSGSSYTVVFTPTANTQSGTGSISVASGAFTDAAGNTSSASSTTSITYDTQVPSVSSVSISSSAGADNTYTIGDTIQVTVNFSEAVTVTGTPTISLVVGSTTRTASYTSGTGTTALVFGYTVATGETDLDGVTVTTNTLALAGGTILDAAGNASTLTHSAVAASTSHKVDTTAPTVSLTRSGSGTVLSGQTVTITFTFSEAVTGFELADIERCPSSANNGTIGSLSGSGTTYTAVFTPTADTSSGNASPCVIPSAVVDAAGNTNANYSSALNLTIDTRLPTVTAFSTTTANGTYKSGSSINITATTSEAVQSGNTITATLDTGATVTLTAASAGTSLTGTYTVGASHTSSDLTVSSFTIGTVLDTAGNAMTSTTVPSGSSNIAGASAIVIDGIAPTVTAFSSSTADGTYAIGASISISATMSEAIQSGNTLTVSLNSGATVTLTAASAGTTLTGTYTVASGNSSSDLTVSSFTIGTVLDAAGNAMTSTTVPSGSSNIGGAKAIVVDGVVPTMTLSASPTSVSSGGTSTITFTASEATTTFALADISSTLGTLSNFQPSSSTSYTATFTAAQSVGGTAVITVASGSFSDANGNASAAAFTGNVTVNNTTASSGGRVAAQSAGTNYIVEQFTTVGTTSWVVPSGVTSLEYLVVAGGGGGAGGHGTAHGGGGGGAGGYRTATLSGLTAGTSYTVTVGAGGSGGAGRNIGSTGGNSVFGSITSLGGGGGGSYYIGPTSGGSGGGAGASTNLITGASGTAGQGYAGGNTPTEDFTTNGAGGGGSGGVGANGVNNGAIAAGGSGTASSITGTSVTRAAGGSGGLGSTSAAGSTASSNTGNGGGGGSAVSGVEGSGGAGGSGIVVVRYALPEISTPDLHVSDDLGASSTDNVTSATTLTFTGSAPVGSTVQLYVDGVASGNTCTTSSTTGLWSCDTGVLTDGDKVITAVSTTVLTDSTVTSTSATSLTVTVDATAPTVSSISASSSTLKSGQTSTLTITLSQASTDFVVGDITVSGGTLSSFTGVSSTVYTVVFTPTANTQTGSGSISIASGAFTDAGGNSNTASSTTSITYDTQLPTVSNVTSSATNGTFTIGDSISIQVTFTEAVTVTGTPQLTLETGSTDRAVNYASGSGTTTLTFTYTVQSGDSSADLDYVSTSSLALNGGTVLDAATNTATLTLPAPGATGSLGANKALVVTSAPTKVISLRNPSGTASGAAFTVQPQVSLQDSASNVVVSDNSTVVTASVSAGASLVGTRTATAVNGVATFNNLGISGTAGTAYTITYSATFGGNALTVATQSVTPTVGAATQISITTQPAGGNAGALLATQPVVKVLDSGNNIVTSSSASIDVSASGGTLGGTTSITASSGVATFTDLTFAGTANTNYTLTFASSGFTSQTSSSFSVGVGAATKLVLTTSAATAKYGQAFATQPVVQVQDAGSNVVTTSSALVTASLSSGTVVGTGNATSNSGVATFSGLGITGSPGSYTITYSSGLLTSASQSITVVRGDQSALSVSSTSGTYGAALTLTTSGGSGTGAVTYVVVDGTATGCAESGGQLTVTAAGTCTVTATKALDTNYNAVSSSATTVTFAKANQSSLTVTSTSGTYGSALTLTTSGGTTNGSVTYLVTGTGCSITSGALSKSAAGDCSVTATMAGNGNYEPVSSSAITVTFAKANQSSLTVTSTSGTYGSAVTLTTSGGTTNGSVTYVVTGTGCSITSGALSKSAAGDCSVTATMAGNGNYEPVSSSATTVTFALAAQSSLTVTSTSGTYGSALTLTTSGGTTNGSVTYVVTGTGCSESGGLLSKTAAGDCAVTATMAGNSNYNAVSSSATTVSFARVALTVTADAKSKQYGASNPTLTYAITSGSLVGADSLSGSLGRASGEDVGTYAINQGTLANANYDITYVAANLTISQRPITVTADAATKQYGASDPTFTYAITSGSLVGSDSLSGALGRTSGANVGTYALNVGTLANANYDITFVPANLTISQRPITVTAAAKSKEYGATDPTLTYSVTTGSLVGSDSLSGALTRVSGDAVGTFAILRGTVDNTNYDITYVGALLTISQRPITVTADAKSKEYGATDPTLTYTITTGSLVGSDSLSGSLSRVSGESVGTYAIGQGNLANSNYDITYASANLSVTQRAITVTADAKSKEYGATDPTLTYSVTTGSLVGSDSLSGALIRTSGEDAGTYVIGQGSLANSNYAITFVSANLTVAQRAITVTADAQTKEYGATDPTFTYAVSSGSLVGSDTLSGSLGRTSGANVGTYALNIGTLANANYDITFVPANLTVTQRPITVTAANKTKVFGSTDPSLTYSITTGSLVGSDSLSGSLSRASGENVGTYSITQGTLANGNYDISFVGATLTVSRASQSTLSVTTSQVTYGTSVVLGSSGGSGTGDVSYAVTNAGTAGCSISSDTLTATGDVGTTCTVTATKAQSTNYNSAVSSTATITVIDRAITVTATSATKTYGDADPTLAYTITSGTLVGGDTLSGTLGRNSGENVGTYAINQGTLANANYAITFVGANLTISQRPITLTAANRTKTYGDSDPSLAYSITSGSLVGSDAFSGSISRNSGENIGTYVIGRGTLANSNYAITFNNGSFSISGANQSGFTLSAASTLVTYQDTTTLSTSGGNGNGAVTYSVVDGTGGCTISGNTLTAVAAGTCIVTASKAQEGNYNAATSNDVTITVAKRAQVITFADPADRNFSTTAFTLAPTVDSGLTPVLSSQTTNVCTVSGLSVSMVNSGTCTLTATSASTANFTAATDVTQSFDISAVVPYAPILDSLTASDGAISASFTIGNSGGSTLTNHEYSLDNGVTWNPWPNGSITSPLNISNLTNGVQYDVKIRAVNAIGAGAESNMLSVTPLAPVIVVASPVQTAESTTTVVSSSTTVFVVTTVKRNPQGRGTTTTIARRAVTTTVASRNGQLTTTTTTVITTTTTGATTTTLGTTTSTIERAPAIIERATSTTVKTQTSIFQSFTPTVPATNVPDTIPARLEPTQAASVVAGQAVDVVVNYVDKQQVHASIGESVMMISSVGENGSIEPLLANGSVLFTRGSTMRVDGMGMLPGSSVEVWLHSTPIKLGEVEVKADGTYAELLSIPSDVELGGHKVHFIGSKPDGSNMEFALGVTIADDAAMILNRAGAMSQVQASSLADANVVSVGTLSSEDSSKLMLWFLVILILVAGLVAAKPQRIGVVASRTQRFEMTTPWLNGFTVPRLLMVLVGVLAGFGAANSAQFDVSAPSTMWVAIVVALGVLDVIAGGVAGAVFVIAAVTNMRVHSFTDIRLLTVVVLLGILPNIIARAVRPPSSQRVVSVSVSLVMHAVIVVSLLNLLTPVSGMQYAVTQSIAEVTWLAVFAVVGRELLNSVTQSNEDQRAAAIPALRLVGALAVGLLLMGSPVASLWTIAAWVVLVATVVIGLRIRAGLQAPRVSRVFISSVAAGFLLVLISLGAFVPNNNTEQITGATSVLPIGDLKVIGELDVLIDGYPRTFVAVNTGKGEVTFINGAIGQSLTIDSHTTGGERIPLSETNQLQLVRGEGISISANGYAENETMNAWLFSDPVLLGNASTNGDGALKSKFQVPDVPEDGPHTLQIRLVDADGKTVTFAIPILLISQVPNGAA